MNLFWWWLQRFIIAGSLGLMTGYIGAALGLPFILFCALSVVVLPPLAFYLGNLVDKQMESAEKKAS